MTFRVYEQKTDKEAFRDWLRIADPQDDKIDRYLESGHLFVLEEEGVQAVCVIAPLREGVYELKNISVRKEARRQGHGHDLIESLFLFFPDMEALVAGTGDHPDALAFYERCGFARTGVDKDYFTREYDEPVVEEDGTILRDRILLQKTRHRCAGCGGH